MKSAPRDVPKEDYRKDCSLAGPRRSSAALLLSASSLSPFFLFLPLSQSRLSRKFPLTKCRYEHREEVSTEDFLLQIILTLK